MALVRASSCGVRARLLLPALGTVDPLRVQCRTVTAHTRWVKEKKIEAHREKA